MLPADHMHVHHPPHASGFQFTPQDCSYHCIQHAVTATEQASESINQSKNRMRQSHTRRHTHTHTRAILWLGRAFDKTTTAQISISSMFITDHHRHHHHHRCSLLAIVSASPNPASGAERKK